MKSFFIFLLCACLTCCTMASCDKMGGNSLIGWYTDLSEVATTAGFERINQAIDNHERIYTTGLSNNYDRYATRDLFFEDGRWFSYKPYHGTCRFLPDPGGNIFAIHIIDKNTLIYYRNASLYDPDYVPASAEIVGKVYGGRNIGPLVYYDATGTSYQTYTKYDNKLVVSNGDVYTVTSSGLIKDGSSSLMSKYDPSKEFN